MINVSVVACIPTLKPVDQTRLAGAAVRYAAIDKDAVLVAAAATPPTRLRAQNPDIDATDAADPRNWDQVVTISTPAWFSDYVLSVSATIDAAGQPAVDDSGRGSVWPARGSRWRHRDYSSKASTARAASSTRRSTARRTCSNR